MGAMDEQYGEEGSKKSKSSGLEIETQPTRRRKTAPDSNKKNTFFI